MRAMRETLKKVLHIAAIVTLMCISPMSMNVNAADVLVNVPISAGTVSITAPTSFTFSAISVSFNAQTVTQAFTGVANYFVVTDLKGVNSGYNTTIQLSGNLTTGGNSIASTNVAFKSETSSPTLLSGTANPRVVIDSNANSFQALNTARNFIKRDAALNTGVLSQYWQTIQLQITVPASQPAGAYAGTLVYTLIEN